MCRQKHLTYVHIGLSPLGITRLPVHKARVGMDCFGTYDDDNDDNDTDNDNDSGNDHDNQ